MTRVPAAAKINLALLVGPLREDGLHEVVTILQRVDLCDSVAIDRAPELIVEGYRKDTLVRSALTKLGERAGDGAAWRVQLRKRIPLAAGLGGGSADAGVALSIANGTLEQPLPDEELGRVAAEVGTDVPFFLSSGPKLAEGAGERLRSLELPQDYWVVLALPRFARKRVLHLLVSEPVQTDSDRRGRHHVPPTVVVEEHEQALDESDEESDPKAPLAEPARRCALAVLDDRLDAHGGDATRPEPPPRRGLVHEAYGQQPERRGGGGRGRRRPARRH